MSNKIFFLTSKSIVFHIWLAFGFCMHVISLTHLDLELWLMSDMARSDKSRVKFVYDNSCFEVQVEALLV